MPYPKSKQDMSSSFLVQKQKRKQMNIKLTHLIWTWNAPFLHNIKKGLFIIFLTVWKFAANKKTNNCQNHNKINILPSNFHISFQISLKFKFKPE